MAWRQYAGGGCKPNFGQAVAEVLADESPMCLFNQSVRFPSHALTRDGLSDAHMHVGAALWHSVCATLVRCAPGIGTDVACFRQDGALVAQSQRSAAPSSMVRVQGSATPWHDYFACRHKSPRAQQCRQLLPRDQPELQRQCATQLGIGDPLVPSLYAPQLAWWLTFFPPERFLVLPSVSSRDAAGGAKVLFHRAGHFFGSKPC